MSAIILFFLRLLLLGLSYAFLSWIIYTIFADLKNEASDKKVKTIPLILLSLEIDNQKVSRHFRQFEIILGRDNTSDFQIEDETISLQHCKLFYRQGHWWVDDLESTNGTYLGSSLVTSATILTDGDVLGLGKADIKININSDTGLE